MKWAWHVARLGKKRNVYMDLVRKAEGRNHSEGLCIGVSLILIWIVKYKIGIYE
jgi:hypothetical protein